MKGNRKYRIGSLLVFIFLVVAASCHHKQPPVTVDWHKLHRRTRVWIRDSAYDKIFPLDSFVYQSAGSGVSDINEFMGFALDCIDANFITGHSDIYRMLRIIQGHFETVPDSVMAPYVGRMSDYYEKLGLYRRALEVLVVPSRLPDSLERTKATLSRILLRSESALSAPIRNPNGRYTSGRGGMQGRFCDLLTALPANGWYDEKKVVEDGKDSLIGYTSAKETASQFYLFLTGQRRGEQEVNTVGQALPQKAGSLFMALTLDEQSIGALPQLIRMAKADLNNAAGGWVHLPVVTELLKASKANSRYGISSDPENHSLFSAFYADSMLIVALYLDRTLQIFIIKEGLENTEEQQQPVYTREIEDVERLELVDLLSNGRKELMITTSSGSGRFFDAEILDLQTMKDLFTCADLYHGDLKIVELDNDKAKELITTQGTSEKIQDCNQCPSRYYSQLYDYDSAHAIYQEVAEDISSTELRLNTSPNLFGLSPLMIRSASGGIAGTNVYAFLDSLHSGSGGVLRDAVIERLDGVYQSEYDILADLHDYSRSVMLEKNILSLFDQGRIASAKYNSFRLQLYMNWLKDLFYTGDYESFQLAERDTWYHSFIDSSNVNMAFNYNLMGLTYLNQGKYGSAFDCFFNCYQLDSLDENPAPTGNLALYFSVINDKASSYDYSLKAADKALRSDDNVALNLFLLARAGVDKLTEEEQLDYMIRAIRIARGDINGEQILMILEGAAQLAIKDGQYDLGLKLLDQAIEFATMPDWEQMGAYILLLYSDCLDRLHLDKERAFTLNSAIKLARGISRDAYISGCYSLSQLNFKAGNLDAALSYSQLAFDSVSSFRKTIGELTQKFSFLTDKKQIAAWHLNLLRLTGHPISEIFDAMDAWKMQSFIDAYKDRGIYQTIHQNGIHANLDAILGPSDLLVEFSINEYQPFGVTGTVKGGLQQFAITASSPEISQLVAGIKSAMDVNNPETLDLIRRDKIGSSLSRDLSDLYAALFSKLEIPANIKRILIVPDESLYGVPWSALKIPGTELYFMDRFEYSIFPSVAIADAICRKGAGLQLHTAFSAGLGAGAKATIVASLGQVAHPEIIASIPSLSAATSPDFSFDRLVNGETEAKKVGTSLQKEQIQVRFLLDHKTMDGFNGAGPKELAIRSNFLGSIKDANILHCISHGIFNPLDPMQSCLFLDKDSNGNRLIMPRDLIDSNLSRLSLVSLSACQTGVNNLLPGSEPIGFLRSFLGAGTSHVVLTDWEVDDRTTGQLFENFYSLIAVHSVSFALNEAKRMIRKQHPHPFFWSGVTLYGSPN